MLVLYGIETPNTIAFRATGKMEASDFDQATAEIEVALVRHDAVNLYIEIDDLQDFTAEAFLKNFAFGLKKLKDISRFGKVAVVGNQTWIRNDAHLEPKLLPGLTIKTFVPDQKINALAWLKR